MSDNSRSLLKTLGLEQPARPQPVPQPAEDAEDECRAFGYLRGVRGGAGRDELAPADRGPGLFPLQPSGFLALQPLGGRAAEIHRRSGDASANPRQQLRRAGQRFDQFDRPRLAAAPDPVGGADGRGRSAPGGHEEPTIDRIEVAEFPSNEELQEWLKKHASAFVRKGK